MGQEKMSQIVASTATDVTIGIDISKHHLDVHVFPEGLVHQFTNDRTGHAQLIAWIAPRRPTRVVFEATGAYHRGVERALAKAALPGVKVNPWQARRFAEASGRRVKTDPVDAAMLARFGATLQPDIRSVPDPAIDSLAELLAARRALVKDRTAALNRGKTLTLALLKRQNLQRLKQIEAQIADIDREHAAVLAKQDVLKARFDILLSIPGLGPVTALAMLIDMPELGTMDAKKAASLGGLAPITRQSGNWQGKSHIQGGRAQLRQTLYMPALVAIRFNPPLKATYLALRKAGKPAKVAIVAVMRKLLIIGNALLRDNRRWSLVHAQPLDADAAS
jgi:transposase